MAQPLSITSSSTGLRIYRLHLAVANTTDAGVAAQAHSGTAQVRRKHMVCVGTLSASTGTPRKMAEEGGSELSCSQKHTNGAAIRSAPPSENDPKTSRTALTQPKVQRKNCTEKDRRQIPGAVTRKREGYHP